MSVKIPSDRSIWDPSQAGKSGWKTPGQKSLTHPGLCDVTVDGGYLTPVGLTTEGGGRCEFAGRRGKRVNQKTPSAMRVAKRVWGECMLANSDKP